MNVFYRLGHRYISSYLRTQAYSIYNCVKILEQLLDLLVKVTDISALIFSEYILWVQIFTNLRESVSKEKC